METIGYFSAIIAGISLGLIGGGGSILTVPILVYLFAVKPELATTYSLFIVGIAALIGSYKHYKLGNLNLRSAAIFGIPSIVTMLVVRKFALLAIPNHLFSIKNFVVTKSVLILILFAALMIAASASMIKKQKKITALSNPQKSKLIILGLLVGIVTGFLGAGGGFLIIPALIFFAGLQMKEAVGTSLLVIAINALIGFTQDILMGVQINFQLLLLIAALALMAFQKSFVNPLLARNV